MSVSVIYIHKCSHVSKLLLLNWVFSQGIKTYCQSAPDLYPRNMPPQKVSPIWNCFIVDPEDSSNAKCKVPAGNRIIQPEPEPEPEFRSGLTGTGLIFRKSGSGYTGTGFLFKRSGSNRSSGSV